MPILQNQNKKELAEILTKIASNQLMTSADFKRERFRVIHDAEDMMLGKVKQKTRSQFNVPLPVLSGFYDSLCSDLDDPVQIKVKNNPSKNLSSIHYINDALTIERKSLRPGARWDYKDRISRRYAVAYGRGILKYFSSADPYTSNIEAVDPNYFHCQPNGGGLLERHLFVGEEGILRTRAQIDEGVLNSIYDAEQVALLVERAGNKEYLDKLQDAYGDKFTRFKALNLNPEANDFVGEPTFYLAEWVLTHNGERWYLLFDPWTRTWIRLEKLSDLYSSGYYPWISYATHEDDKNFWSTSILADILYPVADSITTLFNQELTNRQKQNLGARAYDKDMFKNVQKLDEAQYRPDALVPADTFGGTRQIAAGLYSITTPQLQGTVDLIQWLNDFTSQQTGIFQPMPVAQSARGKNSGIMFANIQQIAKRIDYRSHSYTEAWGELTLRYIQGIQDNMTENEVIDLIGVDALGFKRELKKIKLSKDDIQIFSTKQQNQEDAMRKQQKAKSLEMVSSNPNLVQHINGQWYLERVLKDIGGWEEEEVEEAMDMRGMGGEMEQFSAADNAIKQLLAGKDPEMVYYATISFQRKILDFTSKHRMVLGDKFPKFIEYVRKHNQIVTENMAQLALRLKSMQAQNSPPSPQTPSSGAQVSRKVTQQNKIAPEQNMGPNPVSPDQGQQK